MEINDKGREIGLQDWCTNRIFPLRQQSEGFSVKNDLTIHEGSGTHRLDKRSTVHVPVIKERSLHYVRIGNLVLRKNFVVKVYIPLSTFSCTIKSFTR